MPRPVNLIKLLSFIKDRNQISFNWLQGTQVFVFDKYDVRSDDFSGANSVFTTLYKYQKSSIYGYKRDDVSGIMRDLRMTRHKFKHKKLEPRSILSLLVLLKAQSQTMRPVFSNGTLHSLDCGMPHFRHFYNLSSSLQKMSDKYVHGIYLWDTSPLMIK
jgi:hypothetical protein